MWQISGSTGFVTNSSSVVYSFDRELLADPDVKSFMEAYGIVDGYVGEDLWHRGRCGSLLMTEEQVASADEQLRTGAFGYTPGEEYSYGVGPLPKDGSVVVVHCDETQDLTYQLCDLLQRASRKKGDNLPYGPSCLYSYN